MGLGVIARSFLLALQQLPDPRFRRVVVSSILITLAALFTLAVALSFVLGGFFGSFGLFSFWDEQGHAGWWVGLGSFIILSVLSVFLIVPTAAMVSGFFADHVASAVEERHYPHVRHSRAQSVGDIVKDGIKFLGLVILVNSLALLVSVFLLPFSLFVFLAANGWLLGREYMHMVAQRHVPLQEARGFRKAHSGSVWSAGILMALLLGIPILNLLVPVLAIATFTHLFHRVSFSA